MRILIFSKFNPYPPTAGGTMRMWTLSKALKADGEEVKFVVPVFSSPRNHVYDGIQIYEVRISLVYVIIAFFLRKVLPMRIGSIFHYLFMITYFEKNLVKKIQFIAKDSDVIQCEFTWLYRIPHYASRQMGLPFILTIHDINSDYLNSYLKPSDGLSRFFIRKILKSELTAYNSADAVVCFTRKDFDELVSLGIPQVKIKIIPHGITSFPSMPTKTC